MQVHLVFVSGFGLRAPKPFRFSEWWERLYYTKEATMGRGGEPLVPHIALERRTEMNNFGRPAAWLD